MCFIRSGQLGRLRSRLRQDAVGWVDAGIIKGPSLGVNSGQHAETYSRPPDLHRLADKELLRFLVRLLLL